MMSDRHRVSGAGPHHRTDRFERPLVPSKKALVRRPSPLLADGLVTHVQREKVDVGLAGEQWEAYVEALRAHGWEIIEVEPADDCPDSVFVEDTVVMYRNVALITRPGAESRRGVQQLRAAFEPLGARVVAVPVSKVLHLKSAVTALPDGTVIGHIPKIDRPSLFPGFLSVPEESGAHVVLLGSGKVLMAASAPKTAELLTDLGHDVVTVDISEFEKLEGCVTCLSVRLRELYA